MRTLAVGVETPEIVANGVDTVERRKDDTPRAALVHDGAAPKTGRAGGLGVPHHVTKSKLQARHLLRCQTDPCFVDLHLDLAHRCHDDEANFRVFLHEGADGMNGPLCEALDVEELPLD